MKNSWINRVEGEVWFDNSIPPKTVYTIVNSNIIKPGNKEEEIDSVFGPALIQALEHLGIPIPKDIVEYAEIGDGAGFIVIEDLEVNVRDVEGGINAPMKNLVAIDHEWLGDTAELITSQPLPAAPDGPIVPQFKTTIPARHYDTARVELIAKLADVEEYATSVRIVEALGGADVDFASYQTELYRLFEAIKQYIQDETDVSFESDSADVIDIIFTSEYKITNIAYRKDNYTTYAAEHKVDIEPGELPQLTYPVIISDVPRLYREMEQYSRRSKYYMLFYKNLLTLDAQLVVKNTWPTVTVHEKIDAPEKSILDFGDDEDGEEPIMTEAAKLVEDNRLLDANYLASLSMRRDAEKRLAQDAVADLRTALITARAGLTSEELYRLLFNKIALQTLTGLALSCILARLPTPAFSDFVATARSRTAGLDFAAFIDPVSGTAKVAEAVAQLLSSPLNGATLSPEILKIWVKDAYLATADYLGALSKELAKQLASLVAGILSDFIVGVVKTILETCSSEQKPSVPNFDLNDVLTSNGFSPSTVSAFAEVDDSEEYLQNLSDFFDVVSSILTPTELCLLLKGDPTDETIRIIKGLLGQDQFKNVIRPHDREQIILFFKVLGNSLDDVVCDNSIEVFQNIDNDELCAISDTYEIRKTILSGAGFNADAIEKEVEAHKQRRLAIAKDMYDYAQSPEQFIESALPADPCDFFSNIEMPALDYTAQVAIATSIDPIVSDFNSEFQAYIDSIKSGKEIKAPAAELYNEDGSIKQGAPVTAIRFSGITMAAQTSGSIDWSLGNEYTVGLIVREHFGQPLDITATKLNYAIPADGRNAFFLEAGFSESIAGGENAVAALKYTPYMAHPSDFQAAIEISQGKSILISAPLTPSSGTFEILNEDECFNGDVDNMWSDSGHHIRSAAYAEDIWNRWEKVLDEVDNEHAKAWKLQHAGRYFEELLESNVDVFRQMVANSLFMETVAEAINQGVNAKRALSVSKERIERPFWDFLYDMFMHDYTVSCDDKNRSHLLNFEEIKERVLSRICVTDEDAVMRTLASSLLLMLIRVYIIEYMMALIFLLDSVDFRQNPRDHANYLVDYMRTDIAGRFGEEFLEFIDNLVTEQYQNTEEAPIEYDSDGEEIEVQEDLEEMYTAVILQEWQLTFDAFYRGVGLDGESMPKDVLFDFLHNRIGDYAVAWKPHDDKRFLSLANGTHLILERYMRLPDGTVMPPDDAGAVSGTKIGYRLSHLVKPKAVDAENQILGNIAMAANAEDVEMEKAYRLLGPDTTIYLTPIANAEIDYDIGTEDIIGELSKNRTSMIEMLSTNPNVQRLLSFELDLSHAVALAAAVLHIDTLSGYSTRNSFALSKLSIKNVLMILDNRNDFSYTGCGENPAFNVDEKFRLGCSDLDIAFLFGSELDLSGLCAEFDFAWRSKISKLARKAPLRLLRGLAQIADPAIKRGSMLAAIACIKGGESNLCDIVVNDVEPFPLGFGPPLTPIGAAYLGLDCEWTDRTKKECEEEEK